MSTVNVDTMSNDDAVISAILNARNGRVIP